jgi:hypothetical protein
MTPFRSTKKTVLRGIRLSALMAAALLVTSTAQAELNYKSGGTPPISCDVTYIRTEWPLGIGEWRELKLTYYLGDDPTARLNYHCEAKFVRDIESNYFNCREHECKVENSTIGNVYDLRGNNANLELEPGVNKQNACSRLLKNAGIWVQSLKKTP